MVRHDLRHDIATMLAADLNTPLAVVKEITGHAHVQMLERYVNPGFEQKRRALRELAEERERRLKAQRTKPVVAGARAG